MILKSSDPAKPTTMAPFHLFEWCSDFKILIFFKILTQDLEKRAHRRCTDFSKSRILELAVGTQTGVKIEGRLEVSQDPGEIGTENRGPRGTSFVQALRETFAKFSRNFAKVSRKFRETFVLLLFRESFAKVGQRRDLSKLASGFGRRGSKQTR